MSKIKILNNNLEEQGTIQSVLNSSMTEIINSDKTLRFSAFLKGIKHLITGDNIAEVDNDYFDIIEYEKGQSSDGKMTVVVDCEHVSYRLNDPDYNLEYFTWIGTPTFILGKILDDTGFAVGTVEFADTLTYSAQETKSRRQILMEFVALLGGEVDFNKFTVNILTQRGSSVPKDLLQDRNIEVLSKKYSKREKDSDGNPLVSYSCALIKPMAIVLGDVVTIDYESLDINVQLRVVSLTTDPYNKYLATFEIGNFYPGLADDAYRIETSTLAKGKTYYGARISPENGFESIRSDKMARSVFNADTFAMQAGDGTGSNWTNKLYFDPVLGKYVFDGELSANIINALSVLITPNLYADKGYIAELTVDMLDTGNKVLNYLNSDTSDVNYIKIYDQYLQFITASTDGSATMQATNRGGAALYWMDETHTAATTSETDFPVMIYTYTEFVKMQVAFVNDGTNYTPQIIMGAGTGNTQDSGKTFIYKATDGFYIEYKHSVTGQSSFIKITDEGIDFSMFPKIIQPQAIEGVPKLWIQPEVPTEAQIDDAWIDVDDYTRYDKKEVTESTVLVIADYEVIRASGTITITLHEATTAGIIKKIKNVGDGIITLVGTIDNKINTNLFPMESVELITNGTSWDIE